MSFRPAYACMWNVECIMVIENMQFIIWIVRCSVNAPEDKIPPQIRKWKLRSNPFFFSIRIYTISFITFLLSTVPNMHNANRTLLPLYVITHGPKLDNGCGTSIHTVYIQLIIYSRIEYLFGHRIHREALCLYENFKIG